MAEGAAALLRGPRGACHTSPLPPGLLASSGRWETVVGRGGFPVRGGVAHIVSGSLFLGCTIGEPFLRSPPNNPSVRKYLSGKQE